jgi:hypothetical protein
MFDENLSTSCGDITPFVFITISRESRFVTSQNLITLASYFTFIIGEKFASIRRTFTSSSLFFSSSIDRYQADFSTLIFISKSIPALSISVIYKSGLSIEIVDGTLISQALTTHTLDFFRVIHSIQGSILLIITHFRFSIISKILSFIQGIVEYS